jgi:flavin-dependent dehydrogenase
MGRPAAALRLLVPPKTRIRVELPQPIVVFPRRLLDGALLDRARKAGAVFRDERVRELRIDRLGAHLRGDRGWELFDAVVGADGASSIVRRSTLGQLPSGGAAWATGGFWVEGLEEDDLYVEFMPDLEGYLWVFPRTGHASVGIMAPLRRLPGRLLRGRVLEMLERRYPGSLDLPRQGYGATIPIQTPRETSRPRVAGARFALVGDAARQADAITGEGIQQAIEAADLLGAALDEGGPIEGPRLYAERWARGSGRELAVAARWASRYYGPATVRFAVGVALRSSAARRVMADMLVGAQPYTRLGRRLIGEILRRPA